MAKTLHLRVGLARRTVDARPQNIQSTVFQLIGICRTDAILAADLAVRQLPRDQIKGDLELLFVGELQYFSDETSPCTVSFRADSGHPTGSLR